MHHGTTEFFVVNKYEGWTANKRQVYGIRGQGELYNQFWKNSKRFNFIWESDDWPWSYVAMDEEREQQFVKEYSEHFMFSERDEDDPPYDSILDAKPVVVSEEARLFNTILIEEIQKEINREVINTICNNSKV
jgi:hypothetical protein